MTQARRGRRADYLRVSPSKEQVETMWQTIERTQGSRSRAPRVWLVAGLAAVGAAALLVIKLPLPATSPTVASGAQFQTQTQTQELALPDGSMMVLGADTRLVIGLATADETRLRLKGGSVTCDVPPRPGRRFAVESGGYLVRVLGTRFEVSAQKSAPGHATLQVRVERGKVEVLDDDGHVIALVQAGASWQLDPGQARAAAADARRAGDNPDSPPPDVESPSPPEPGASEAPARSPGAPELFERGAAARLAGDSVAAAAAYDRLRRKFPHDERAGLAAFELGRIRLDALNDARGAAEAFRFTLARPSVGVFPEDAEAGLVKALARMDDRACAQARASFLHRHPRSPHVMEIRSLCP
jgi:TolA-binding protein